MNLKNIWKDSQTNNSLLNLSLLLIQMHINCNWKINMCLKLNRLARMMHLK